MKHLFIISAIILLSIFQVSAQNIIPAKYAAKHLGKKVTICDKVFSQDNRQFAAVLFLGGDRPNQLLTVTIEAGSKTKFNGHFDAHYIGKDICVTGVVVNDKDGKPLIRVTDPKQIRPLMLDNPVKQKGSLN